MMNQVVQHPSSEYPIIHLATKLGENEELDKFVRKLCEKIKKVKEQRKKLLEKDWDACEENFWATGTPDDSADSDSQLDFTLTFEISQDAASNLANPIFAQDTIMVAKPRPGYADMAAAHDALLDWMCDRADMMGLVDDSLTDAQIFSKTIAKAGWSYRERKIKYWDWDAPAEGEDPGQPIEREEMRPEDEGCFPHIVDPRRIYHPIPTADIDTAEWIAEEFDTTIEGIEAEIKRGFYREDFSPHAAGDSTKDAADDVKNEAVYKAYNESGSGEAVEERREKPKLMECYTTFEGAEVVLYLDVERNTWVAAIENFFQDFPRPYSSFSWYKVRNSIDGKSLGSVLEPLHRAYVAIMNILLNAGVRSVEPLIIALEELGLSQYLENGHLVPGLAEVKRTIVENIDSGIKEIRLTSGDLAFLLTLAARIEKHMRDAASIPSAFRGEELAERPTAHGTTSILEKAMQPLYKLMERYRLFISRIVQMQYARYRQFNPQSMKFFIQSQPDGEMMQQMVEFPPGFWRDQIAIETRVNSQTMSKQIKKQEILAMVEKLPEIWRAFAEMGSAAVEGSPISPLAGSFIDAAAIAFKEFLTEFEVPEVRDAIDVDGAKMAGEALAQTFAQYEQRIAELESELVNKDAQITDLGGEVAKQGAPGGQRSASRSPQAAA